LRFTKKQEQEAIAYIVDCFNYSKSYFRDYYTFCKALHALYNVEIPTEIEKKFPTEFPALVPVDMHNNVEDLVAALYDILFSSDYVYRASPDGETPEYNARMATTYLAKAMDLSNLKMEYTKTILSAIKYGCGVGYVDAAEIEIPKLIEKGPIRQGGEAEEVVSGKHIDFEKNKVIMPQYTPIQLRRFFPEPVVTQPNWAVYQEKVSFVDLLQELEKGDDSKYDFNPDALWLKRESFPKSEFDEFYNTKEAQSQTVKDLGFWVELFHFRGWMPIWDDRRKAPKFVDCVATLANRSDLIQWEENEWYYPAVQSFIRSFLFPTDQEQIIPVGKVEASFDTFMHKFYVRNQVLLNLVRNLNTSYVTDNDSTPQFITAESGKVYHVKRGAKLEPLTQAALPHQAIVQVDSFTDEMLTTFGNTRYMAGQESTRKETAYGISVLKESVEKPQKFQTQVVVHTGLFPIGRRYLDIGQLYLEQMPMKLFDSDEIVMLGKDKIFGQLNLTLDINDIWNQALRRQEFLKSIEIFKDDPDIDQIDLKRRFFRSFGFSEVDKLVPESSAEIIAIDKENQLMVQNGIFVPVNPKENHLLHFKKHRPFASNPIVAQHIQLHIQAFQDQQKSTPFAQGGEGRMRGGLPENEVDLLSSVSQRLQPGRMIER